MKTDNGACLFNALYWDHHVRNEGKLHGNPRLGPVYRTWGRMKDETKAANRDSAARTLNALLHPRFFHFQTLVGYGFAIGRLWKPHGADASD